MLTQGGWASLTPTAPDSGSNSPPKAGVDRILVTAYRELAGAAGSEEGPGSLAEQQQACGAHWAPPQLPPVSARWPPQGPQVSPGARTRPRLLALSKPLWVPARAPRAAPSVATAKTSLAPEVPEPWQPLHWGARPSFGDWKLKSSLSSQSFHRDANNPLGCK